LVFTDQVRLVYSELQDKIGSPEEVVSTDLDLVDKEAETLKVNCRIPHAVIKRHLDVDDHEIAFANGESILLSALKPQMKG
jgi:hypothetical protein